MELADMQDLGSCAEMRWGSSPHTRTTTSGLTAFEKLQDHSFFYAASSQGGTWLLVCTDTSKIGRDSIVGISIVRHSYSEGETVGLVWKSSPYTFCEWLLSFYGKYWQYLYLRI